MNQDVRPNLYIIGGPNGSGKTTFAKEFLPNYADCFEFVNADLIASGLSPFKPEREAIKAGRLMLEKMHSLAESQIDFAKEYTIFLIFIDPCWITGLFLTIPVIYPQ